MNFSMNVKKPVIWGIMVSAAVLLFGVASHADPFDEALKTWDDESFHGRVMEVHRDYLVVSEVKIMMVDTRRNGTDYKTKVMDLKGSPLTLKALAVGMKVFVKGSVLWGEDPDKRMLVAREIYLLPGDFHDRDIEGNGILNSSSPPW
jgi:hypothetical protein